VLVALTVLCLALVALLAYREWGAARERREATAERAELIQRIQAPDLAIDQHVRESRGPDRRRARPIAADDDAAFLERSERG
jgi:type II secretory pathway component PulJ